MQRWMAALVGAVMLVAGLPGVHASAAPAPPARAGFVCAGEHRGDPARPIPDLARQQRIVERVEGRQGDGWRVRRVRASHLGVVALVSGRLREARAALRQVDHVEAWGSYYLRYVEPGERLYATIARLIERVLLDVRRRAGDTPGRGSGGVWVRGGAALLTWKAPVPRRIERLAGVRRGGVEVRILPRPYSAAEFTSARTDLLAFLEERGLRWSTLGRCPSERGLVLGVPGPRSRFPATDVELAESAGMPVRVRDRVRQPSIEGRRG